MNRPLIIAAMLALSAAPASAKPTKWTIDPSHSAAEFVVDHLGITKVRGAFTKLSGTATVDLDNPLNDSIEATIDATSVDTRDEKRDGHLKSPDFFDVAKFPTLTFKSTKVTKEGGVLKLTGDLTLHGVTKSVTFTLEGPSKPVKSPWGATVISATGVTVIKRGEYGLKWNKAIEGGSLVGEDVAIGITVELIQAK
jgi:polyisoprenoid-binding protein YceI